VQDCLERAVSRWYQRRDGDVRAWLFTILHNLAINQFRQSASRGRHVPIDETNEDISAKPPRRNRSSCIRMS
jgi:DNA-directed RNA polymerase specialized sigma subunit, sigma24 homolog